MSRSKSSIRKFKFKKLWQEIKDLPYSIRFGQEDRDTLKEYDDVFGHPLGKKDFSKAGRFTKRKIARRIRHKSKDALRHNDEERVYRKWDGQDKIKTGYG